MPDVRLFALCAIVSLAGCPAERPAPVRLVPPQWQDGEVSVYNISRHDSVLYQSTIQVHFSEELLGSDAGGSTAVPTLELTTVVQTVNAGEYFSDSSTVVLRRDNLEPLRSYRDLETDLGSFELQAMYGPGRVSVTKQSIDGTQVQQLRLPPNAYDNEMVSFLLRALPLAPATRFSIVVVVPLDMRKVPVEVNVLGTKLIPTRLGDIMCRETQLTLQNRQERLWYELAEPHRLVGLYDPDRETELRLVQYRVGTADTTAAVPAGK